MPLYEHVFLARQDLSAQQIEDLTKQYSDVITGLGGKVTKNEYWGLKSLSYRINKNRKAHMTLLNVDAPSAAVTEIERQERLSEDVLRYLTIRVEELEEGPSAMMRKSDRDRDERGERGGRFGDRDRGFGGDRAEPHHRGLGQEAARTRPGDQAQPLPRPAALRDQLSDRAAFSSASLRSRQRGFRACPGSRWLGRTNRSVS